MKLYFIYSFLMVLMVLSCKKEKIIENDTKIFIHISHTRSKENPRIDSLAEKIDFSQFDIIMLGGDLAFLSSENDNTMDYLDSIFDLSSPQTLWSLGHHDYSDLNRISHYTKRNNYYAYWADGITFIILDTRADSSCIIGNQLNFFNSVVDTLVNSTHLIVMTHKLIWMYGNDELAPLIDSISNARLDNCPFCLNPNNFYDDVYPKLAETQKRGIDVVCVAGDIGFKVSEFEYKTADSIEFLASGFDFNKKKNEYLIFEYETDTKKLNWRYKVIER